MPPAEWTGTQPRTYDIATGFYPQDKPKTGYLSHPCLIIAVQRGRSTGLIRCEVIYGSSNLREGLHAQESDLLILGEDVERVGLFKPTRFYFSELRPVYLPWDERGFECWARYKSPVIGRLTAELVKEAEFCLACRQAR